MTVWDYAEVVARFLTMNPTEDKQAGAADCNCTRRSQVSSLGIAT
ncbi:MAG: hypothetical protein RIS70_1142, partial [Planctomycetota bacterium]